MSDGWKSARFSEGGKAAERVRAFKKTVPAAPQELVVVESCTDLKNQLTVIDADLATMAGVPRTNAKRLALIALRAKTVIKLRLAEDRHREWNREHLSVARTEFDKALSLLLALRAICSGFDLTPEENEALIEAGDLLRRNRRIP